MNIIKTNNFNRYIFFITLIVSGCSGSSGPPSVTTPIIVPNLIDIPVSGLMTELGNFDPAPTVDGAGGLWMSYSHISLDISGIKLIGTRLASSVDNGSNWSDAGLSINLSTAFVIPPGITGAITHETSRLMYNPFAVAVGAAPWIVLWHRYITSFDGVDSFRLFQHGWIGMKSGSSAMTLGAEVKLFTGSIYDAATNDPLTGAPLYNLNTLDPALNECVAFTEPGLLPKANGIYVAMLCATATLPGKIVLLRCDHDMSNCAYKGVLIDGSEASGLEVTNDNFSAPELVTVNGDDYLIVTPSAATIYRGCAVYKITNLEAAIIERVGAIAQATGFIKANGDFNGACGYVEGLTGSGVMMSEAFFTSTPIFRLFTTDYNF